MANVLLPIVSFIKTSPLAEIDFPPTPLIVLLVLISSSSDRQASYKVNMALDSHGSIIYQHVVDQFAINVALHMQWLEVIHVVC